MKTEVNELDRTADLIYDVEYVQSANSLFHFMKKDEFLFNALQKGRLVPRYCVEDISYIGLTIDHVLINQVAVLQKCFCDMPLHQLTKKFYLELTDKNSLSAEKQREVLNNTHTAFYGEYAIAFSKKWGIKHGLTPVHYISEQASTLKSMQESFSAIMSQESVQDEMANEFIDRLAYIKPLQGTMGRTIEGKTISFVKNFHDEKEWRYVPPISILSNLNMERLIFKSYIRNEIDVINKNIESLERYGPICLDFSADDIRYLIVPSEEARINLIKRILGFSDGIFKGDEDIAVQKSILVSKILVLKEIEKDW